ncbi:hypothetical protein NIES2119_13975 [[Phormidium ambiguum] IAM M-71]|uniref:PEP-CTERM sorting domain-containing protein n=2 Tax=[Phormidium ambiguum] IAM M-71 TaxID=454136 RepID=A0A1U7IJI1_9CYAN|nr:hypothetical protein NIES2119_13975 [Phormidium ambiguum IAM M-71]
MLTTAVVLGFAASPSLAATFDAAADFSINNNPNSVWQYGWSSTLGSALNLLSNTKSDCGGQIDVWFRPNSAFGAPIIANNKTGNTIQCGTGKFAPGELLLHPGASNEYSVVRWVAPEAGNYSIATKFAGADFVGPTTTDVHVLYNGVSLFNDLVNGFGDPSAKLWATTLSVAAGDIIDFAVGFGSGGFWYDTTSLDVTISSTTSPKSVPESTSTLGLLALSIFGASSLLKRKQQESSSGFK